MSQFPTTPLIGDTALDFASAVQGLLQSMQILSPRSLFHPYRRHSNTYDRRGAGSACSERPSSRYPLPERMPPVRLTQVPTEVILREIRGRRSYVAHIRTLSRPSKSVLVAGARWWRW